MWELVALAFTCDYACVELCVQVGSDQSCFGKCACGGERSGFGGEVVLPDGRRYYVEEVPLSESTYVQSKFGCDIASGSLCFEFVSGEELLQCLVYCNCESLVFEQQPIVYGLHNDPLPETKIPDHTAQVPAPVPEYHSERRPQQASPDPPSTAPTSALQLSLWSWPFNCLYAFTYCLAAVVLILLVSISFAQRNEEQPAFLYAQLIQL